MTCLRAALWKSCALMMAVLALLADSASAQEIPKHLELGRMLVASVPPDQTSYRHKGWVTWKGDLFASGYSAHTDCSGLISSLFEKAENKTYREMPRLRAQPQAKDYYGSIARQEGFLRIDKLADVEPGDIIAMLYSLGDAGGTGHVMLVDAKPVLRATDTDPIVESTRQWEVSIIDSSASAHGKSDSRRADDGSKRTGLGRGVFRLYADPLGTLAGYAWSLEKSSRYVDPRDRPIAIGRIKDSR
jgi:hypothetical protein